MIAKNANGTVEAPEGFRLRGVLSGVDIIGRWAIFNFVVCLLPVILPSFDVTAMGLKYLMASSIICTIIIWAKHHPPMRFTPAIVVLVLLQIWFTYCAFDAEIALGRGRDFGTSNYFLIMAVIYFLMGSAIVYLWPQLRTLFINVILAVFLLSAVVGFLQFLKIPPFIQLAAQYNSFQPIDAWSGRGGVRAIGLASWPEWFAVESLCGFSLICSRLLIRRLSVKEFCVASFFLMAAAMAQSRIMYATLAACIVVFLYLLIQRDKLNSARYVFAFLVVMMGLFVIGRDRLAYVLETDFERDDALKYRREVGWKQAYNIMEKRPWTGIGPDSGLVWEVHRREPDQWTRGEFLDNGFLLLRSWGGYPAVVLFYPILAFGFVAALRVVLDKKASEERRSVAFFCAVAVVATLNNSILNNGFTHIWMNCMYTFFAGLAMPGKGEMPAKLSAMAERIRAQSAQALAPRTSVSIGKMGQP